MGEPKLLCFPLRFFVTWLLLLAPSIHFWPHVSPCRPSLILCISDYVPLHVLPLYSVLPGHNVWVA